MLATLSIALAMVMALSRPLFAANDELQTASIDTPASVAGTQSAADPRALPIATSIDLGDVYDSPSTVDVLPRISSGEAAMQREAALIASKEATWEPVQFLLSAEEILRHPNTTRRVLEVDIPPATATRLIWKPSRTFSGMAVDTPVLVVNGANDGPTMCLTAAVHGDELNGIEMVRRVMYDIDPHKLHGMIIGVPIVNLLGFSRNSRYLPDRRDLNRYFPGNPHGNVASRIADAFFNDVVRHCNTMVDLHTGSFYRTNIPQLRADLSNPRVADFVELFGDIPVLNSRGNKRSLRAAAVRAGIPTVTLEAGEPMRMQREMVEVGVKAINTLLAKSGMYSKLGIWVKPKPAFYDSFWVRSNTSGILFSRMELGDEVNEGDILGAVNNPISNEQSDIVSPYKGRILGMALDQFVMPGFAVYHIGIHAAKDTLQTSAQADYEEIDSGAESPQGEPEGFDPEMMEEEDRYDDE
mgnify:FL=1